VLAGTVAWLVNKPPTVECVGEGLGDHQAHTIRAVKVVVRPWLGQHHVYGVFMVPNRYRHNKNYAVSMVVRGFDRSFVGGERFDKQDVDGFLVAPGNYLLRRYVPTRLALWFLVNGRFGDLRNPCNWTLVFIERSS
jgi:hypothetical protein